jgi:DNA-binding response OmpR family regulator
MSASDPSVCLVQRDPRRHLRLDDRLYIYPAARAMARGPLVRGCSQMALRIFLVLLAHPGAVVARGDLIDAVWGDDPGGGPDNAVNAINVAIFRLRKMAADLGVYIEVEKTRGAHASFLSRDLQRASS